MEGWERALKKVPSVVSQDMLHLLGGIVTEKLNFGAVQSLFVVVHDDDHQVSRFLSQNNSLDEK